MPSRLRTVLELLLFLIGTFVPVILLASYAANAGGLAKAGWITPLGMLTPMLSAMFVQKAVARRKIKDLGFSRGRIRWWFLAPMGFAVLVVASLAISVALTPSLVAAPAQIAANLAKSTLLPHGLPWQQQFAVALAITVFAGPLLNLPIFLGEETGWRGFMNGRLCLLFGRSGLIAGGVIWALWHLPIVLLGHNYPHHPWLGMAIWIPICVCLNILFAAIRERGRSILPCALAHGIMNQLSMLLLAMTMVEARYNELLHGPAGLIGLAVLIVPAALAYRFAFPRQAPECEIPTAFITEPTARRCRPA